MIANHFKPLADGNKVLRYFVMMTENFTTLVIRQGCREVHGFTELVHFSTGRPINKRDCLPFVCLILEEKRYMLRANNQEYRAGHFSGWKKSKINWLYMSE
jgi:hypothetical protein